MRKKIQAGRFFLLLAAVAGLVGGAFAQTAAPDEEVIRVETQLVDVPLVVTDRSGRPLLNLKRENFVVYEDEKRQEIAEFAATSAPFEVALLLDTSGSTRGDLDLIRRAAQNFIAALRPGDRVAVIAYKTARDSTRAFAVTDLLTPLTGDRAALRAALEKVSTSNGTPYYDSLLEVAEKVFAKPAAEPARGRRALVALTDGVDSVSAAEFDEAREALGRAGLSSYFIQVDTREFFESNLLGDCRRATRFSAAQIRRYYRVYYPRGNVEKTFDFCALGDFERLAVSKGLYELADRQLRELARLSGGRVFPAADLTEARTAFKSVADEIGTVYSLGYYSTNDKRDGTYRRIRIELRGVPAGAQLRAREGYTAPTD